MHDSAWSHMTELRTIADAVQDKHLELKLVTYEPLVFNRMTLKAFLTQACRFRPNRSAVPPRLRKASGKPDLYHGLSTRHIALAVTPQTKVGFCLVRA